MRWLLLFAEPYVGHGIRAIKLAPVGPFSEAELPTILSMVAEEEFDGTRWELAYIMTEEPPPIPQLEARMKRGKALAAMDNVETMVILPEGQKKAND